MRDKQKYAWKPKDTALYIGKKCKKASRYRKMKKVEKNLKKGVDKRGVVW
jgi:hypothetical protein